MNSHSKSSSSYPLTFSSPAHQVWHLEGPLAQSVEQRTFNPWVVGSIPTGPTSYNKPIRKISLKPKAELTAGELAEIINSATNQVQLIRIQPTRSKLLSKFLKTELPGSYSICIFWYFSITFSHSDSLTVFR